MVTVLHVFTDCDKNRFSVCRVFVVGRLTFIITLSVREYFLFTAILGCGIGSASGIVEHVCCTTSLPATSSSTLVHACIAGNLPLHQQQAFQII